MSETERNVVINKATLAENSYHVKLAYSELVKQLINKNRHMSVFPNYQINYQNKQKPIFNVVTTNGNEEVYVLISQLIIRN